MQNLAGGPNVIALLDVVRDPQVCLKFFAGIGSAHMGLGMEADTTDLWLAEQDAVDRLGIRQRESFSKGIVPLSDVF